jgi:hypothetical protein
MLRAAEAPCKGRIRFSTLTCGLGYKTIDDKMTEHGFLAVMLAVVVFEVVRGGLVLAYFTYRISRVLERVEGVGAATFLEVREVLGQSR